MNRVLAYLVTTIFLASSAFAETVQQSGSVTRGHLPYWVTSGVVADGGTSADSPITSIGATGTVCSNSARATAVAWYSLCLGYVAGVPTISLQNNGTAPAVSLNFNIGGAITTIPTGGGDFIFGQSPYTVNHVPSFAATTGKIQDSGLAVIGGTVTTGVWGATPIAVANGGTGGTDQSTARTGLGLGSMATQNSNAVAVTGGSITGMPTPSAASDVAIKSYVDATATGLNVLAPSTLATAAVLPNTPTYANGASGVGATLTAGSNTTLTVDGTAAPLTTVVLVKNQAAPAQNGIYTVTTAGSGAAAWVLTRATYFDQAAEIKAGSYTFVTAGATNINSSYILQSTVTTVGTDPLTFALFATSGNGVTALGGMTGPITCGTGIGCAASTITNTGVTSIGGVAGAVSLGNGLYASGGTTLNIPLPLPYPLTNGEFVIDTLNVGAAYAANATFENWAVDGVRIYGAGGTPGIFQVQQVTSAPDTSFQNSLGIQQNTRNTAPTAGDNYHIEQWIEPLRVAPLQMGTATAQQFTYSWYQACNSSPTTWSVAFLPADNSRSFVGVGTYNASVNTFQRLSITVPGDTTVTASYSTNGMKIIHDLGFGTSFEQVGASTVWAGGATFRVQGTTNFIQNNPAIACFVTGLQIDLGASALPFRHMSFNDHLAITQRYKCKAGAYALKAGGGQGGTSAVTVMAQNAGANPSTAQFVCPVEMYFTPRVNLANPRAGGGAGLWENVSSGAADSGAASSAFANTRGAVLINAGAAGDVVGQLNGIAAWLGACPGNTGVGTGCSQP